MSAELNHRKLYRLPWNLTDNAISWFEPTKKCNIYCEGCYSANNPTSHKSLEQVKTDLEVFGRLRNSDGISIAGGDPLTHPDIVEIVRMIRTTGNKPILNTNGLALTLELTKKLKDAGLEGFTFHIDSKQKRPDKTGATEMDLCELRMKFANMAYEVGGLSVAFNSTVYEDTIQETPALLGWAQKNIDKVHVMVFILFRAASTDGEYDYYLGDQKVSMGNFVYASKTGKKPRETSAREIVKTIQQKFPDFMPCAYLNGTEKADDFKWLLTCRLGSANKIYGYMGPKFMEIVQAGHHLLFGRYLAYTPPGVLAWSQMLLPISLFDRGGRETFVNFFLRNLITPWRWFCKLYFQSVMIIQPVDLQQDGSQSMCDGCPDMTVWNGKLVWSCRLEEPMRFGGFVRTVPKKSATLPPAAKSNSQKEK